MVTHQVSQRDILAAFDFCIGSITPQGLMDELWLALPTLRKATEPVKDGWKSVQAEIWDRLFDALIGTLSWSYFISYSIKFDHAPEPDVLQFPISLLTASAVIDGLIIAIARYYKATARNSGCRCSPLLSCTPENTTKQVPWQVYVSKAMDMVKDVVLDVTDVLQIRDVSVVHYVRPNGEPLNIFTRTIWSAVEHGWVRSGVRSFVVPSFSSHSIFLYYIDDWCVLLVAFLFHVLLCTL